jgi:hypothetical protein
MLRKKKQITMKNTKLRARKLDTSGLSSNSITKLANPAAAGGLLGARKFNAGGANNLNKPNAF